MRNANNKNNLEALYRFLQFQCGYHGLHNIMQLLVLTLFLTFSASVVFAAPVISTVTQNVNTLKITGSDFGTKLTPAPVYWNNLDSETLGGNIPGWKVVSKPGAVVSAADSWAGGKSLYFAMKSTNDSPGWNQILKDMGASNKWYFHFKVRFNKNDSNTRYQWKSWRISSSSDGYAWNSEPTSTVFMNDLFWFAATGWNGPSGVTWNDAGASKSSASLYFSSGNALLLNEWQTVEQFIQQSTTGPAPDGINRFWRDGTLFQENTSLVTGTTSSGLWRYMMLGQNINNTLPVAGQLDVDIYFDDIYVDNTQARVMICDTPTWANRTQCEIQPPTDWQDGLITVNSNTGRFLSNQKVNIYVIDSNGAVNSNGYTLTLGGTPPVSPKGGMIEKYIP